MRRAWLKRLFDALQADEVPYLELLGDFWGELCASKEIASEQADLLIAKTRLALAPDRSPGDFFRGTTACLSALYEAERYDEICEIAGREQVFWSYKRWAVRALAAKGKKAEALRLAESSRGPWASDLEIDRLGEEILLSSGSSEEAYLRYGLTANRAGTYLATFRAIARRYPEKKMSTLLADLVRTTPGEEGKWFAAAKDANLLEEALALARLSPCDPRTLTRAAQNFSASQPEFAVGAGLLALYWLVEGYGFEITAADVLAAHRATMDAAERLGKAREIEDQITSLLQARTSGAQYASKILGRRPVKD